MSKLPWAKYSFSILIVAIVAIIVAKFLTTSPFVLVPLCMGLYWLSVRSLAKLKGYQ